MKSRDRRKARSARSDRRSDSPDLRSDSPELPARDTGPTSSRSTSGDPASGGPADVLDRWFVPIAVAILVLAAAFRLPELALNPFHHDEGVNGFFTTNLVRDGTYTYDPENYHGPSLYYLALVSETLFGLTTEAMRLVPVAFGLLTVGLVFGLRRHLGSPAVLAAATLLAVSPGAVYVSRYFIHESILVAATLALVVAIRAYLERREARHVVLAAVAAALLFTTKETAVITVAVLALSMIVALLYLRLRSDEPDATDRRGRAAGAMRKAAPASPGTSWEHLAAGVVVFIVIYVLLFSSFFTNFPQGIADSLAAYGYWLAHGDATQNQPLLKYLEWIVPLDAAILGLGVLGGLAVAIRGRDRLWLTIGAWAAGISIAYSLVSYKTPWILLNMLLPLALLGGYAITELWQSRFRIAAPIVLAVAAIASGGMAYDLNFVHYDDEAYDYVYVHSTRDMLKLVAEIEATADRAGTAKETGVVIMSPDYWPLPWYLREYPRAGFFGSIVDTEEAEIVANVNQRAELGPQLEGRYREVGTFNLRPGVDLVLYVRNDVPQ